MNRPLDGWDADERAAIDALAPELDELQARHAGDPPIELLRAARANVLPDDLQATLDRRLESSRWDRALVEGVDDLDVALPRADVTALFQRIQKEHDRAHARAHAQARRWLWQPAFAAAAVLVVAGSAWLLWRRAPETTPARPAPEAQIAEATPPSPSRTFVLPLEKPQIKVSAGALTFRGTAGENRLLADLKPAFDALRIDDYATAARELAPLAARYPQSIEVAYYQGIAALFLDDAAGALASLTRAESVADPSFASDVTWYEAVASERAGRLDEARTRLRTLCAKKETRSAQACAAVDSLR